MSDSDKKEIEKLQERIMALEDIKQANILILDTAVDGIIAISDKGVIEKFNKSAERLFGYLAEEVIVEKVNILMPEPMRGEHDSYLDNYS